MASETTVTITLNTLQCIAESQSGGSNPYLWPAMVSIDKTTGNVGGAGIPAANAHNVLKQGMKAGDSTTIETTVGVISAVLDNTLANLAVILAVGMFSANQTPDDAVTAGYNAFQTALQAGVQSNLLALISTDPAVVEQAQQEISDKVTAAVTSAISNALSALQKVEIGLGTRTLDSTIGNGSTSFLNLANTDFTLSIGKPNAANYYEISGSLTAAAVLCADQRTALAQATGRLSEATLTFEKFQAEYQRAPPSAKAEIEPELIVAEKDVEAAQKAVDAANQALQACLSGS
jgi:hypothetical protein